MEIIALNQLEQELSRLKRLTSLGSGVAKKQLSKNTVEKFYVFFYDTLPILTELQHITIGESNAHAKKACDSLISARKEIKKLTQQAKKQNGHINHFYSQLKNLHTITKQSSFPLSSEIRNEFKRVYMTLKEEADKNVDFLLLFEAYKEISGLTKDKTALLKKLSEVNELLLAKSVTNNDLVPTFHSLYKKLDDAHYLLLNQIDVHPFVYKSKQTHYEDMFSYTAPAFVANRPITVFDSKMGDGTTLHACKSNIQTNEPVTTYGQEMNLFHCQVAKEKGIDHIAKRGLYECTSKTFDIVFRLFEHFVYAEHDVTEQFYDVEKEFETFLSQHFVRPNGYLIFNWPSYRLTSSTLKNKLKHHYTIRGLYRSDDDISNVVVVCQKTRTHHDQLPLLRQAVLLPNKLPHYRDIQETFPILTGEVLFPEKFRPTLVEEEDIIDAFKTTSSTLSIFEKAYRPKEATLELNNPVQKYKLGHLPAIAATSLVDGVYDDNENACLFSCKTVQQIVQNEVREMVSGETVEVVSRKKKNGVTVRSLYPNGEIVTLLDTAEVETEEK